MDCELEKEDDPLITTFYALDALGKALLRFAIILELVPHHKSLN
ncbi:MAG: hypothetical protein VXZ32_03390 [Verrucomicrobiota bacterium]|nr:hypothetical protein [Verrucomicrobiota bacterium]